MRNLTERFRIYLSILILLLLVACSPPEKKYRIGVAQCSSDEWRDQMNEEIMREILFHDNASVEIRSANDSNSRQIADIEYFVDNGFDAIIVAPNEAEALTPVVRSVFSKGIPVIVFDRTVNDSSFTAYIELDNIGLGKNAGRYAAALLSHSGGGKVLEITGLPGSSPADERHKGFMETIDSVEGITVAGSFHGDWRGKRAFEITDSVLRANPDISLIYAHNDRMAIEAAQAAKALGRGDIKVLGTDGAPALGVQAVADSVIDATFIYPTVGERVVRAAIDILDGKVYPRIDHIPSDDYIDISNASFHLKQNRLLRTKTNQIELLNERYVFIKDLHSSQRVLLWGSVLAALLLASALIALLYFLRQKIRLQKSLLQSNNQLRESNEAQAVLYQRLEEATHEKLVFFTNISHDFLTPLTLIAEPIDKIAAEPALSPTTRLLLDMMRRNVQILKRMLEQILDFRKYQNGKSSLRLTETDPVVLVKESAEMFRNVARQKKITLSVGGVSEGKTMAVDADKLERILFNLVSNALKYSQPGGSVKVICLLEDAGFHLSVSNTGRGISPDEMNRIFERYYRIDAYHSEGVGIGLALTKAFVELHGGEISVESMPGMETVFRVTLPVRHIECSQDSVQETEEVHVSTSIVPLPSEIILPAEDDEGVIPSDKPLLLVIDDNEEIRRLVRIMTADHFEVIEAANGKEGIRRAVKYVPDVIVCDIMMPEMDGLETTRRLKEEKTTSHIPVLILTACRLDEQRVKSYDSGADAYISKPFSEEMLRVRLKNLIDNRRRIFDLFLDSARTSTQTRRNSDTSTPVSTIDHEFYSDFLKIVRKEINNENLSVKDIASRLGIGPTQLTRKIKALTGTTPVDIIRELRLKEGRHLLITTDRPVAEIAYSLGFSTPQYFARCFRDKFGISPTELRNSVR